MTDTMTRQRLIVTINEHPNKRLSPNAPPPASVAAKRGRASVVWMARVNGYDAARLAVIDHAVDRSPELYYAACRAQFPDVLVRLDMGNTDLAWMAGPVDVDIVIGWGVGSARKDDDNAIAMCKSARDGVADLFGASDRRWRTRRVVQTRSGPTRPHGQLSFTFTPRDYS